MLASLALGQRAKNTAAPIRFPQRDEAVVC